MNLRGKTALVTGAAVRIGRAIAERLASEGVNLVLHHRHSGEEARALQATLSRQYGVGVERLEADLVSEAACETLVRDAVERLGPVDLLVNNASIFEKTRFPEMSGQKLLETFWPNLFAPLLLTRAFAAQGREGRVVNLLDRRITANDPSCVPYLLTKQALASATRLAALEYAPRLTVNAVAPGPVLPPPGEDEAYLKERAGPIPLERRCTEEEVADAVHYLLAGDAMTGQVIFIDAGQHLLG